MWSIRSESENYFFDGHSSHITALFVELVVLQVLYVVVEPSHISIILQVAEVGGTLKIGT